MVFEVRKMKRGDADGVISMLNLHFPHVNMTHGKLKARIARGSCFVVADSGTRIIGFVELRLGKSALLRGIAVEDAWRGKGVGTALVKEALDEARRLGNMRVWLKVRPSNLEAINVYKENGFVVEKESLDKLGEKVYLMEKRLEN